MLYKLPALHFQIIRPGMPLGKWYAAQADKPYLLMNASLYDGETPIGTIIENGKLRQNAGNGFGFGILPDGSAAFGAPWRGWDEYLSGYPGMVQDGRIVELSWNDKAVFDAKRPRIAIGETKDGFCVLTHGGATLSEFAQYCAEEGAVSAANLDGGGSVFLILDDVTYHDSARTPYNAIAGWL